MKRVTIFVVALISSFGSILSGCDSESLQGVYVYHVTIFSEEGEVYSEGTLFIEFSPTERVSTAPGRNFEHDITGTWRWRERIEDGLLAGRISGITSDNGNLVVYLDSEGLKENSSLALGGDYTDARYLDFEGEVYVRGATDWVTSGESFYAELI